MKKLLMVVNVDWFFISHRLCIAQETIKRGWEIIVACEDTGRRNEIEIDGIRFIDFKFSRSGTNPLDELKTLKQFYSLYKTIKPDVVHHITLKPVIYGSIVAKLLKINGVVNAVSGLGYNFTGGRQGVTQKIMVKLMRYGFSRDRLTVIFQNGDDQRTLEQLKILSTKNNIIRIKGSGVDLVKFSHSPLTSFDRIRILFPSRMLWDKGVRELRDATDLLKVKYKNKIQFVLSGLADNGNKAGVSASYLNDWQDGDYVVWIGYQKNMVKVYQDSHVVILPSYREGMPKTLIEACAIGRAIITTDAIGCRECVDEGVNGFKVTVANANELANAIEDVVNNTEAIIDMGRESRLKAEREFDVNSVIDRHIEIYSGF
ncbi:alpha-D-quinac alpha-1,3-galactosyltransferase [Flavobacterium beibuense F44-8]|uniref:Alpha-D-quinac alpha-1,3-galactosyltransferase n=1 Tax=Flavobacterium beibuense F44-8 TaxID=1406840 RepID=A0A0A2LVA7_9FLAO|nr:glycosyltransferase family 4 protein [Flavobacterium beibuense]KGO84292.1 alpha-D-quinac alpha-1,3-galactosyltransferase [Flavobacterium beibuense F44-8]